MLKFILENIVDKKANPNTLLLVLAVFLLWQLNQKFDTQTQAINKTTETVHEMSEVLKYKFNIKLESPKQEGEDISSSISKIELALTSTNL